MFRLLPLLALLISTSAWAELRFAVWSPPGYKYSYIVPVREGESLERAVGRYQGAVNNNHDLRTNLIPRPLKIKAGKITDFAGEKNQARALIVANKADDMLREQEFIKYPGNPLNSRGVKPYVLPLGAHLGLTQNEFSELHDKIKAEFDLVQGIGGDDWFTKLYGEKVNGARGSMSWERDHAELQLYRTVAEGEEGPFISLHCRAMQGFCVAHDEKMIQDIPKELGLEYHQEGTHKIRIDLDKSRHLKKIYPWGEEIWVNTLHHQAVDMPPGVEENEIFRVVARDLHGVVEFIELKNGRGIGSQFHPELMSGKHLNPYYDYVADQAKAAYRRRVKSSCSSRYAETKNRQQ